MVSDDEELIIANIQGDSIIVATTSEAYSTLVGTNKIYLAY